MSERQLQPDEVAAEYTATQYPSGNLKANIVLQTFQNAQTAAQNLATTINTSPGSVFKTLVTQSIHGRVEGVVIWGPSAAPPSGKHLMQEHTLGSHSRCRSRIR